MKYDFSISDDPAEFEEIHSDILRFIETYGPSSAKIMSDEDIPDEDGLVFGGSYGTLPKVFTSEILNILQRADFLDEFRNTLRWKAVIYPVSG